ncbi:MAG TPA: hypothetical protein VKR30_00645 [Candidatus Limnocylindrales bacterium]|nr:hypothetical protein [Candidatus Limnocylindrales bacterium]
MIEAHITPFRLTDPELDFWVDVRLRQFGDTWLATADLAGTPDVGASRDRDLAVLFALWSLGSDVARRMTARWSLASAGSEMGSVRW